MLTSVNLASAHPVFLESSMFLHVLIDVSIQCSTPRTVEDIANVSVLNIVTLIVDW